MPQLAEERTEHGPSFIAYYEQSSTSAKTLDRFQRIKECAMRLLASPAATELDVLDIGCGAGTQSILWSLDGHRVSGLDVSPSLVALGRKRAVEQGLEVAFHVGVAQKLPFEDSSFDVVLMPELLEHVADWEKCLAEAVRVLRPCGLLYVSTTNRLCPVQQEFSLPAYSWYPGRIKRWAERKALTTRPQWANHTLYPAVNWFTFYELRRWLSARGISSRDRFDVMRSDGRGRFARLLVGSLKRYAALRALAHVASEGTTVWGRKEQVSMRA